jgi:hypothetical protein
MFSGKLCRRQTEEVFLSLVKQESLIFVNQASQIIRRHIIGLSKETNNTCENLLIHSTESK